MNPKLKAVALKLLKPQKPSLNEWLMSAGVFITLLMFLFHFKLLDNTNYYKHINHELGEQLQKAQRAMPNNAAPKALKAHQARILNLLQLIAENLNKDLFLTELQISEHNLGLRGRASNTNQVKQYAESFMPQLKLQDFSFENNSAGGTEFNLRFDY